MKNISFDNPYLLLVLIPLVLAVVIPFLISKSKDNQTLGWKISLGLHIAVSALIALALAGLSSVTVLTKTTVFVVADVSYSSDRNLDEIDGYIAELKENLPDNSSLGVVCFGKNSVVLTSAGRALKSVSEAKVDDSSTDIVSALNFTETLFKGDTLKRIVLITDGNDTVNANVSGLASCVERLTEEGIKVDAIFLNNTLKEGECEVQISSAEHAAATYQDKASEVKLLLNSSAVANVELELYSKARSAGEGAEYELINQAYVTVEAGFTAVTLPLPTDVSDVFDYKVVAKADSDISPYNNEYTFTQAVEGKTKVLLITGRPADETLVRSVLGDSADIDVRLVPSNEVPFMLEELAVYDEYIVSNVDLREVKNVNAFIDSLDIAVSQYGKSLITMGDLYLQDEEDHPIFKKFSELLPVEYGNSARDGKLYTIVLDASHSMFMASKFFDARDAAIRLLSLLNEDDQVCLITFSGQVTLYAPRYVRECKDELIKTINGLSTSHGTDIGMGLEEALRVVEGMGIEQNQVMLISDGLSFSSTVDALEMSTKLYQSGTPVSAITISTGTDDPGGKTMMKSIVNCGVGGVYTQLTAGQGNVDNVIFGAVADNVTESVINRDSKVNIVRYRDSAVSGLTSLPNVLGYIQLRVKHDATVPVTVDYVKPSGYKTTVPFYAYRSHGNGRVASLATDLAGRWCQGWDSTTKSIFLSNILSSNVPKENHDYPFTVKLERDNFETYVELTPSILYPGATAKVRITTPDGKSVTRDLIFDSQKYFYTLDSLAAGSYSLELTYTQNGTDHTATVRFDKPYLAEYDAFAVFDKTNVYEFMRNFGGITEGEIPSLENDESEVSTYKVSYAIPLLIAAVVLFLLDILLRTLKIRRGVKNKRVKKGEGKV
ncbi:MAG: VWA domain-containing protein [Clostridia bacterium]|nr:VWA domain-containing protein [Clostridia bacterium]